MQLRVSRILHAGYVFECGDSKVAFDPIFENPFSRNCYAFPKVRFDLEAIRKIKFDAVFISHHHDDHCSFESLHQLDRATPIFAYCIHDELFEMLRELGFKRVQPLRLDEAVTVGTIEVTARRALDDDVDSMFHIRAAGLNVLNVVDSWIDPSALKILSKFAPFDLVLWPFQTMRELDVIAPAMASLEAGASELPIEWIEQLVLLNPRYLVPSSCQFLQEEWSWYNRAMFPITYARFAKEVGAALPGTHVVRMDPSASFLLSAVDFSRDGSLSWVIPVGDQSVDFAFEPNIVPPSTSEVAKNFGALTPDQTQRVYDYCRSGLLTRYQELEETEDEFFAQPRHWRLAIYNHEGEATNFNYLVQRGTLTLSEAADPDWTTDVPIAKLYAALDDGESLTSMYVRINDGPFSTIARQNLCEADLVQDPLVRCLFTGVFGAYQRAQLVRLQKSGQLDGVHR